MIINQSCLKYIDIFTVESTMDYFWKSKSLSEMTQAEWESLCDGCGYCCLVKLEDEDTGKIYKTSVACKLLDIDACRCRDYEHRFKKVPSCLQLTPENIHEIDWLPETCAYKILDGGGDLPDWHPLTGNRVHEAGASIKAFAQSEAFIHPEQFPECIID